jgi:hypothetical protein
MLRGKNRSNPDITLSVLSGSLAAFACPRYSYGKLFLKHAWGPKIGFF